jgi:hypothetical protein
MAAVSWWKEGGLAPKEGGMVPQVRRWHKPVGGRALLGCST